MFIDLAIVIGLALVGGLAAIGIMLALHLPLPWIRKLTHLGATTFVIVSALLFGHKLFVIAGLVFAVALMLFRLRPPKRLKNKETFDSYGESMFFVGVAITAFISPTITGFVIPVAILGLADTAAYVIGKSVKSPKLLGQKSLAGSSAFIVVAFLLFLIVAPWWLALIGAIVTSVAELVGMKGSDNITVPVVATLLLML